MNHKMETHKNNSQNIDSKIWYTKFRLTDISHKIETN